MEGWKEVADYSWPLAALLGVSVLAYRLLTVAGRFLGVKLFDDDEGLITLWLRDQRDLMEQLKLATQEVPPALERLNTSFNTIGSHNQELLEVLVEAHMRMDSPFSNKTLKKQMALLIEAKIKLTESEACLIEGQKEQALRLQNDAKEILEDALKIKPSPE